MKKFFSSFDWIIPSCILVITIFSLLLDKFLAPQLFSQQLFYIFLGILLFFIFSRIDFKIWEKLGLWGFLGSIVFLLMPLIFGIITRGALRWLKIGPFSLQPSELTKPFLVISFSFFFSQKKTDFKQIFFGFLIFLIPFLLIFFQPDLGSGLIVLSSWLGILFATGVSLKFIFGILLVGAISFPLAWKFFLHNYQKDRILSFLNPWMDPLGRGYNLIQSTVAVGAGRFLGRGLGRGTQSHLQFLPERHTDFIFASFAEDFGFLGVAILLFVFMVLLWRTLKIAGETKDNFAFLLATGIFSVIFTQGFINIGMNLGLLPVAGVTFPLFSYGGSSYLATMIMLGIVENICYNTSARLLKSSRKTIF